jgi:hypothetical protein
MHRLRTDSIWRMLRSRGPGSKNLSVNSIELDTRRQIARSRGCKLGEDNLQDGADQVVDGIRPVVGEGGTSGSRQAAAAGPALSAQARSWTQADGGAEDLVRHRIPSAHGLPAEVPAQRVWQRQRGASAFSGLAEGWVLSQVVASGTGRIRRDGGHRLGVAKYRRGYEKSAIGHRMRGTEPHGSGKKMGASEVCWSTRVASRSSSSPAQPTRMT